MPRLDVVVPLHGADFERFSLLRRTAQRFFEFEGRALVIVPEAQYGVLAAQLKGDSRFVAVNELELLPELATSRVVGWWKQQALKLAAASLVESDFYLCLDADCFAVRPIPYGHLVPDGKAAVNYSAKRTHRVWYFAAAALLRMPPPPRLTEATPFVFSTELVGALREHLRARFETPYAPLLKNPWKWTEYTLYHVHAWNQGGWDRWHSPYRTKLTGNSVWHEARWPTWDPARSFEAGDFPFTVVQSNTGITADTVWQRVAPYL